MTILRRLRRARASARFALTHNVGNLELHVAHGCNLSCESCSHYSNHNHKGMVSLDEASDWIARWRDRIVPSQFSLLGGEPAINPALADFVPMVRRHWPRVPIRIASNGFLLHRHPDLPRRMAEDGNVRLELSMHHTSPEYEARFAPVLDLARAWERDHGIDLRVLRSVDRWTRRYTGAGAAMRPFADGDPRQSWINCRARCLQLHDGAIWKCAPLAYLGMQDARYGLSAEWDPYLAYRPLTPDCSPAEMREFFLREEEDMCGMCSVQPSFFDLPLPFPARRARPTD